MEYTTPKGVWGYVPPEIFLKFRSPEVASGAPKGIYIYYSNYMYELMLLSRLNYMYELMLLSRLVFENNAS